MTDWKTTLAELDHEYEQYANRVPSNDLPEPSEEVPMTAIKSVKAATKKKAAVSKRDVHLLMMLHQLIVNHEEAEETERRSKDISTVEPQKFSPKPNSFSHHVHAVVKNAGKEGIHINNIIAGIEQAGYPLRSQYHKYSQVRAELSRNGYMYVKVKPAVFRLRNGFAAEARPVKTVKVATSKNDNKVPALKDIILSIKDKYKAKKPSAQQVWFIMLKMGYSCSQKYVMQILARA